MNIADKKCFETEVFILVVDSMKQFLIGQSTKTVKNWLRTGFKGNLFGSVS